MKTTRKAIESFLSAKKIAIAGVSRDTKKFGYAVYSSLAGKGFDVYPINPNADSIGGTPCFQSISALPADVSNLVILTPKNQTEGLVKEAISKGISSIWIQQMSDTPEAIRIAGSSNIQLVSKQCILLWANPVTGIHKFHRTLSRIFGLLPR